MKYLQACVMKKVVDKTIVLLGKAVQEGTVSAAGKKRLAAAHVSQTRKGVRFKPDPVRSKIGQISRHGQPR